MIIDSPIISGSFAASGSLNQFGNVTITGSLAVSGTITSNVSNTFAGVYVSSSTNATSFTDDASLYTDGGLRVTKDAYISGSAFIAGNFTVYGTSSIQYVTSSVFVGLEYIDLNTDLPALRYAGIRVYDSGSPSESTSSLLWDSQNNKWIYSNPSTVGYSGGMLISGPRNTGSLGEEQGTINNRIVKGQGGDHITSSQIIDDGITVSIPGDLTVTGSIIGTISNATSASFASTASFALNVPLTSSFALTASYWSGSIATSSFALTASYATNAGAGAGFPFSGSAVITGSLQVTNLTGSGTAYLVADSTGSIQRQIGSAALKTTQAFTSSAGQTTFSVTNGYTTNYVDIFINGIKLSASEFNDTSGTNIILTTGSFSGDIVEVVKYLPAEGVSTNVLRQQTTFVATAGQTVFSSSYAPGLLDIFYNGSRLSYTEYTANNGTYFTLATASAAGDVLDVFNYSYQIGGFTGIGGKGIASQIAYFDATSSITGSPNFTINGSTMTVTGSLLVSGSGTFTNIGPAVMSGSLNVSGSIVTTGTITAQTLVVQTITSSVSVITGSTNWGSLAANTHTFTGSVYMNPGGLFVSSSGVVGIGTTNPSSLLEASLSQNAQTGIRVRNSTSGSAASVEFGAYTNSGNAGFGKYSTGTNAYKNISAGSAFIYNGSSGDIALLNDFASGSISFIAGAASTAQMFITSGGNVGIGTISPSTLFHVNGSSSRVALITTSGALSSGYYDAFQLLAANQTGGGLSLNIGKAESQNDLAKMVYFHVSNGSTSNRIGFGFYNNDALFNILASGNVGIGTTVPNSRLDLGPSYGASGEKFFIYNDNNSSALAGTKVGFYMDRFSLSNNSTFVFPTAGAAPGSFIIASKDTGGTTLVARTTILGESGNMGIGATVPRTKLQVTPTSNSETPILGSATGVATFTSANTNYGLQFNSTSDGSFHVQSQRFDGAAVAYSLVLQPAGSNVYMGTTSNPLPDNASPLLGILAGAGTDAVNIKHTVNGNNTLNIWQTGTSEHSAISFYKGDTQSNKGLIRVNTSGTTYTSTSDYRLKENIVSLENGLDRLMQLKPSKFNWIETGDETEGFIAHEVQEVFPDAVVGEKDAVYLSTGNIKPQSVDYGRITPLLVKAIQEQQAQIQSLQAEINELKNK